jgi:hypothetical protein
VSADVKGGISAGVWSVQLDQSDLLQLSPSGAPHVLIDGSLKDILRSA